MTCSSQLSERNKKAGMEGEGRNKHANKCKMQLKFTKEMDV
jgi:hypothetical protein